MTEEEIKFVATVTKTPSGLHINVPKNIGPFMEVSDRFNKIQYKITMVKMEG